MTTPDSAKGSHIDGMPWLEVTLANVVSVVRVPGGIFIELKDARGFMLATTVVEQIVLAQHG